MITKITRFFSKLCKVTTHVFSLFSPRDFSIAATTPALLHSLTLGSRCSDNNTRRIPFSEFEGAVPKEYMHYITEDDSVPVPAPGPLLMTAISIFGNQSFFGTIARYPAKVASDIVCADPRIPFAYFSIYDGISHKPPCFSSSLEEDDYGLSTSLAEWLSHWHILDDVHEWLSFSMFYANHATLDVASSHTSEGLLGELGDDERPPRTINTSEGYNIQKPWADLASLIVLGLLYALQLIILIAFAVYIYRNPTWTRSLDAFSLVRVVASMDRESLATPASFPERSSASMKRLDQMDGLIGTESWQEEKIDEAGSGDVRIVRRLKIGGNGALV